MPAAAAPLLRGFSSWSIPSALEMMDRQGIAVAVLSMAFSSGLFADTRRRGSGPAARALVERGGG